MHPAFAGSKKKQREAEAEARAVEQTNAELRTLYAYARQIHSEDELDSFLAGAVDEDHRAAVKSLMEPMVLFKYRGPIVLATELDLIDLTASPEKATKVTLT